MKKWIDEGDSGNTERLPSVFLSHIFVAGGVTSESEREIDLGGARAVPLDVLPGSDYIALGHLHKKQQPGKGALLLLRLSPAIFLSTKRAAKRESRCSI